MASFPGSIYSPTNPVSTNPRTSPSVAAEVAGLNGEVVAIETALGTNLGNIAVFPSGIIMDYAGTAAPTGWLLCQGQAVSRATYAGLNTLANAAGYASPWGPGNGTTTFNVPNLIGLVTIGAGTGYTLGTTGGATTASGVITHTHASTASSVVSDLSHTHPYVYLASASGLYFVPSGATYGVPTYGGGTTSPPSSTPIVSVTTTMTNPAPAGAVASISLYQPYIALQKIIKT